MYRVKKAFDKAEPLYLEAINILEESYGHEDIRYMIFIMHVTHHLENDVHFFLTSMCLEGMFEVCNALYQLRLFFLVSSIWI